MPFVPRSTSAIALVFCLCTFPALPAKAIQGFRVAAVDNSSIAELENYHTNDVLVTPVFEWFGAQILLELTQGSIYRNPFGDPMGLAPPPPLIPFVPSLEFDTYASGSESLTRLGGPADIFFQLGYSDISLPLEIPENGGTRFALAWSIAAASIRPPADVELQTARITLSDDAMGTWHYADFSTDIESYQLNMPIVNGRLFIPEPTSLAALTLVSPLLHRRTRYTLRPHLG